MKPTVALIGPGKVGCAVTERLSAAGYPIVAVIGRDQARTQDACRFIGCPETVASLTLPQAATGRIILLAVADDQIEALAKELQLRAELTAEQTLIHFSGLHPAALMRNRSAAAQLLSIHPLLPFAERKRASEQLCGCPCALEGDATALPQGQELIAAVGGCAFTIDSDKKALYHTAASIAANFSVTLLATARELLCQCGIDAERALPLLLPLVQASLDNTKALGPEAGLTGPIVRGDHGTVEQQQQALKVSAPELLPLYRLLAEKTVELAVKSGRLSQGQAKGLL